MVVVGLGEEGKLDAACLVASVAGGVLAFAQRAMEKADDAPLHFELAATLLGRRAKRRHAAAKRLATDRAERRFVTAARNAGVHPFRLQSTGAIGQRGGFRLDLAQFRGALRIVQSRE